VTREQSSRVILTAAAGGAKDDKVAQ